MAYVYTHVPQNEAIGAEGRHYTITEKMLEYQGRRVLYQYIEAFGVTTCCGGYAGHIGGINVAGYVLRWKYGTNDKGEVLSEIEPIANVEEQQAIGKLLWSGCDSSRVNFLQ